MWSTVQKTTKSVVMGLLCACLAGMLVSCQKGPAQKAGEKIDNAVQDTKDTARDIKNDVKEDLKK